MCCVALDDTIDILQRLSKDRSLSGLRLRHIWPLPRLLSLELSDLVHSFGPLGVQNNVIPRDYLELDRRHALPQRIDCSYGVLACVFRYGVADI